MRAGQQLECLSTGFGLAMSVGLHLAAFAYIASATAQFQFEFELTLPTEIEFGVTEGLDLAIAPNDGARASRPPSGQPRPESNLGATLVDAGVPEPEREPEPEQEPESEQEPEADALASDERESGEAVVAPAATEGPSRLPPGAQLALRIDMRRVRESPIGPDVTQFLKAVPDWQLILAGSGIDPVSDLDRLLVATPNLQRSTLVLAGKHRRDDGFARASVARLARSRGTSVRWKRIFGVPTAKWHNRDSTARTIALLDGQHFSITRRQDLQRVLALAKARELRDAKREGWIAARGPEALLSMGPSEALSIEV